MGRTWPSATARTTSSPKPIARIAASQIAGSIARRSYAASDPRGRKAGQNPKVGVSLAAVLAGGMRAVSDRNFS